MLKKGSIEDLEKKSHTMDVRIKEQQGVQDVIKARVKVNNTKLVHAAKSTAENVQIKEEVRA